MVNQTFTVIYQSERFLVDPELVCNASQKFRDMMNQIEQIDKKMCLRINYNGFTTRNVSNFLKICQNQQTDVQNSELKQICLLAQMFQAEQIFNTALDFIQNHIDNSYFVPSDQLNEINRSQNLILEPETTETSEDFCFDLSDFEYDENYENVESVVPNNTAKKEKTHSVCYQIKIEKPFIKSNRFYLVKDNKVIYMAKQKYDKITIGDSKSCHLNKNIINSAAKITRNCRGYNVVNTNDQEFKIRYMKDGEQFSVKTSFDHKSGKQFWRPMQSKNEKMITGEYNHKALESKKNVVLLNNRNRPAFIVRKMGKKVFEAECHPDCDPVIAFAIALSQIIGPIAI